MKKRVVMIVVGLIVGVILIASIVAGIVVYQISKSGENKDYQETKKEYPYISEESYEKSIKDNAEALRELEENEDNNKTVREIEYYIYYEEEGNVDKFIEEIKALGYNVEKSDTQATIFVRIGSTVEGQVIKEQSLKVLNIAQKYSLIYGGWSTEIKN